MQFLETTVPSRIVQTRFIKLNLIVSLDKFVISGLRIKWGLGMIHYIRRKNLILLCNRHHKIIDDRPDKFTIEILTEIKKEHELSGEPIEEPLNNLVVRLIEHIQKIIDSDNYKWDPASERAYYTARDYLINESQILSQDKDEILKHFKILEEEGSKIIPHKLRVEISWKYIKRKAPHKVISLLSSVIKDIMSRAS